MSDPALHLDTAEFTTACDEMVHELNFADYNCITDNARKFVQYTCRQFGYRSGNLRSALIPTWNALGLPGVPDTPVKLGEKTIKYNTQSGMKINKFYSAGTVNDRRTALDKPSFEFRCFAAEWRKRRSGDKSILKIMQSGLIGPADCKRIAVLLKSGSYAQVWSLLVALLSTSGTGTTLLIGNDGAFRPYQFVKKGNRKIITPKFDFGKYYHKLLSGHSAKK